MTLNKFKVPVTLSANYSLKQSVITTKIIGGKGHIFYHEKDDFCEKIDGQYKRYLVYSIELEELSENTKFEISVAGSCPPEIQSVKLI